eukprot:TRINITY_DN8689_c0_g1_i1.p1 TRINITY_DN8689_c0_g1~~TRINITY_DN8689_c0_g1_i1.p1  ORF type:complete len:114 (-),score=39.72 TRINITY_DN8689_c0_g1_i1:95-436(-)
MSSGIQQLIEAEQKAAEMINQARRERQEYLRQAKDQAEKEVASERSKMEAEFNKKYGSDIHSEESEQAQKFKRDADDEIRAINDRSSRAKQQVVRVILDSVVSVDYALAAPNK